MSLSDVFVGTSMLPELEVPQATIGTSFSSQTTSGKLSANANGLEKSIQSIRVTSGCQCKD